MEKGHERKRKEEKRRARMYLQGETRSSGRGMIYDEGKSCFVSCWIFLAALHYGLP